MVHYPTGGVTPELTRWLNTLESRHETSIDLDLSRCGEVYKRLGSPRPGREVITVAGTNGKGSTVAWISTCMAALGLRTGTYTSPHLMHFTERLHLEGKQISAEALVGAFEEVEAARGDISLTYFEFTTLACFLLMGRAWLDVAVLEVGMGGRLDTVNLVDADLAVITPIGLDHQAYLGEDRLSIGREKAGVLREDMLFVSADRTPPSSVILHARELGCKVIRLGRDFDVHAGAKHQAEVEDGDEGLRFEMGNWHMALPDLPLPGRHQQDNLAASLAAVLSLHPPQEDTAARLGAAIAATRLPARSQRFASGPGYLVDVGHNPMAAQVICESLRDEAPVVCVLAMLADKDAESVALALRDVVDCFVCAGLEDGWRAQTGPALAWRVAAAVTDREVTSMPTVGSAMVEATRRSGGSKPVLVFGSFHTAAGALAWLHEHGLDQAA